MMIVPIATEDIKDCLEIIKQANKLADAIELRLDYFEELSEKDLSKLFKACAKPVLCTCRSKGEGGKFGGSEAEMSKVLCKAVSFAPAFVDIEAGVKKGFRKKVSEAAKKKGAKVILSKHFISATPSLEELSRVMHKMAEERPFAVKIVCLARTEQDSAKIIALHHEAKDKGIRLIAFCMGEKGRESRFLSLLAGGFAAFASLGKGFESAEGQIPITEMRKIIAGASGK